MRKMSNLDATLTLKSLMLQPLLPGEYCKIQPSGNQHELHLVSVELLTFENVGYRQI